jgi:hypothetical protein
LPAWSDEWLGRLLVHANDAQLIFWKAPRMHTYPVELDPAQIVRWALAERDVVPTSLKMVATRTMEVRDIPMRKEYHLGDEEREDLSEVATIATLEIAPTHKDGGWKLIVEVEDESGPRISGGPVAPTDEAVDPGAFYNEFLRRGRGTASVTAELDSDAAESQLTRLLEAIERDRHPLAATKTDSDQ